MQIAQIAGQGDAERVLISFKNVDGGAATITTGQGVAFCASGNSVDGYSAIKSPATNSSKTFIGIALRDTPVNTYGMATVWGVANSVQISNVGTSITVNTGNTLIHSGIAGAFFSGIANEAHSTLYYKYVVSMDTITISATAYVRGMVRAL